MTTVSTATIRVALGSNSIALRRFIDGQTIEYTESVHEWIAIITAFGHRELDNACCADIIDQTIGTFACFLVSKKRLVGKD